MSFTDLTATLAWLGPWAPATLRPGGPTRGILRVPLSDGRTGQAWVYRPVRPARRWIFVVGGVHYDGPTDPRLDRLCRIFANAGAWVCVPFIDDYMQLRVTPRAVDDARAIFDAFVADPEIPRDVRPGLFAVSFGTLPAMRIATDPGRAERVSRLVVFGGYRDFERAFRYALRGELDGQIVQQHDPLNRPVLFQTLLEDMDVPVVDAARLRRGWRRFAARTWGRDEMKSGGRHVAVAESLVADVHPCDAHLFLQGCGAANGGAARCTDALHRMKTKWLDPVTEAHRIKASVHLFHGRDDDVIPWSESRSLARVLASHTNVETSITGLYGHTGAGARPGLTEMTREVATMLGMVRELATLGGA